MIYQRNCNDYYIELLHLLTEPNLFMSLYDKRILDNKVINLVKFLRKIKEENEN